MQEESTATSNKENQATQRQNKQANVQATTNKSLAEENQTNDQATTTSTKITEKEPLPVINDLVKFRGSFFLITSTSSLESFKIA